MKSPGWIVCAALVFSVSVGLSAQGRPDFSGTWVFDPDLTAEAGGSTRAGAVAVSRGGSAAGSGGGGSVTGGGGGSVSGAAVSGGGMRMSGGGAGGGRATLPEMQVTQTATSLTIDRSAGPMVQKFVHTFDGQENVNVNGRLASRTRSRWDGARLVTEGTQVFTNEGTETTMTVKEVRTLASDGTLVIESERTNEGSTTTSKQIFQRK